ncbi:MAG: alpha/beta hydrolase family protein [Phycisphaerales bacterium]
MHTITLGAIVLGISLLQPAAPPAAAMPTAEALAAPGRYTFTTVDQTWHDAGRERDVPVRIYTPVASTTPSGPAEPWPVIVFSHGAGGSREGYAYAGRHLASHGYLVILPQHAGSDTPAMREALGADDPEKKEAIRDRLRERMRERLKAKLSGQGAAGDKDESLVDGARADFSKEFGDVAEGPLGKMTSDPANLENRPRDISFVLDEIGRRPELAALADMSRVGVAGHSFGAYTSLASVGLRVKVDGEERSWPDSRARAAVAMSPQGRGVMGIYDGSWEKIGVPVLCLTGTKDMGQGQRAAAWRRDILGHITAPTTFIEITDANHMTFGMSKDGLSDSQRARGGAYNEAHNRLIRIALTAFVDAYVRGDAGARAFVEADGLREAVQAEASFERAGGSK